LAIGCWLLAKEEDCRVTLKLKKMITIHDELMRYKGNFKSNRKKRTRPDDKTVTQKEEKTENDLISDSSEIITGTVGSAVGVKALRHCFKSLLDDHTDAHFTGRLMKLVNGIYHMDREGATGKKSIFFSKERDYLATVVFHIRERNIGMLLHQFHISHSASRIKATLKLTELRIMWIHVPNGATHYRLLNHLSIISDYTYSEINHRFEPMSKLNTLHAIAYTDYIPVGVPLTDEIVVSLPVTEALSDIDSVIQCVGIEYFVKSGLENFILIRGGSVVVVDVF